MKILLIDDNEERLNELAHLLRDVPDVGLMKVEKAIYMKPPAGLDAVFLTLPAAERWNPNFRSRDMQILRVPKEDQQVGFPRMVITGVNLRPEDPQTPLAQVRIVLEEAVAAARAYNQQNPDQIKTLGFWVSTLTGCWFMGARREIKVDQLSDLLHRLPRSTESHGKG